MPVNRTAQVLQELLESQQDLYLEKLTKLKPIAVPINENAAQASMSNSAEAAVLAASINNTDIDQVKAFMMAAQNEDPFLVNLQNQKYVYKHGVKIELKGQFLDVLDYMIALEKMNWKVYWKSFHYTSERYPQGKASIVVETLGFDNGWIGV